MSLVPFDRRYRRMWMIPRPIRKISPWKLSQVLTLLMQQTRNGEWTGNQKIQNAFINVLNSSGLKKGDFLRDPNSGGARTYRSLLEYLGLIFSRDNTLYLTLAGVDLCKGNSLLYILQTLLLKLQYPSSYSISQNVRIHPGIRIKPICFVLRLLRDPDIAFLTQTELCIPIIYGHNDSCYDLCKEMILKLREGKILEDILINPDEDLYLPRGNATLSSVRDIANTLKNHMESACLVNVERLSENRLTINSDYLDLINAAINDDKYIAHPEQEESFQRAFGSWNREKDNRRIIDQGVEISRGEGIIISKFFEYAGNHVINALPEELIDSISDLGFERDLIIETLDPLLEKSTSVFEGTYLEYSRNGIKDAVAFEIASCEIFRERLLFGVEHTGQRRRPGGKRGGYADGFLTALDEQHCSLLDAKAYGAYSISADDHLRMVSNYIPNYRELCPENDLSLESCIYVSGGFSPHFTSQIKRIEIDTGVPVCGITAKTLLEIASEKIRSGQQHKYREAFRRTKILHNSDF